MAKTYDLVEGLRSRVGYHTIKHGESAEFQKTLVKTTHYVLQSHQEKNITIQFVLQSILMVFCCDRRPKPTFLGGTTLVLSPSAIEYASSKYI